MEYMYVRTRICGKGLTLYHKFPTFNNPQEESLEKQ